MYPGFAGAVEKLGKYGISGVELRTDDIIRNDDIEAFRETCRTIRRNKLSAYTVHAPFMGIDISSEDEHSRVKSVRDIEKAVVMAKDCTAEFVIVHLSAFSKPNGGMKNALRSLETIRETCRSFNVKPVIENTLPGMLNSNMEDMEQLVKEGYYLCLDTGHSLVAGIRNSDVYDRFKANIKVMHLHCNDRTKDMHRFTCIKDNEDIMNMLKHVKDTVIVIETSEDIQLETIGAFINDKH